MKDKMKKALLACMFAFAVCVLSACSTATAEQTLDAGTEAMIVQVAESQIQQFSTFTDEQIEQMIEYYEDEQDTVTVAALSSWKTSKKDLGALVAIGETKVEQKSDGSYEATVKAEYEERECKVTVGLNKRMNGLTELTFSPVYTLSEQMEQAGGNLVIGMGTVFAILIFIAWVISLFKYIHVFEEKLGGKKTEANAPAKAAAAAPAPAAAQAVPGQPSPEELQAIIAAAIAMYEAEQEAAGVPVGAPLANGITVRPLRRTTKAQHRR